MSRGGGGNGSRQDVEEPAAPISLPDSLYSTAVPAVLRRVRREAVLPIACGALAAVLVVALLTFVPPSGDAPSHLFQTWLYRHGGFQLWNNLWYAGRYEFVSYSALYYPLAAQTGELPVLAVSGATLAACFAALSRREWGRAARGPAVAFACTTTFVLIVSGSYPFTAGAACAAAAILALQRGRRGLFCVAVVATLGFSPLAFALLLALLAGLLLGHPEPIGAARRHWIALAVVVVAVLAGVFLQRAFPSGGIYPYNITDALVVVLFSLAGLYVTGRSPRARSLRMLFVAYLILNLCAFLFKSPVGSNATRLFAVAGAPLLWLAANVSRQRSQVIVFPILAATAALQVGPWIRDAYSAWGNPAAAATYWRPAIDYLHARGDDQHRVEAVATWGHWEAYYLARAGFPLARGWFRQDDFPENSILYHHHLTAAAYDHWLRVLGVRYVVLPDTTLDYSAAAEARLLRSGNSGLELVWSSQHLRIYELPAAAPIVSAPPGSQAAMLIRLGHQGISFLAPEPGRYLVRVRYSPYWQPHAPDACVARGPDGMTEVTTAYPGVVDLTLAPSLASVADAMTSSKPDC
jgi:hypothetical protein